MQLFTFLLLAVPTLAFPDIFDSFFGGGGGGGGHQQQRQAQNAPSDASAYRQQYFSVACDRYLCPDTLACVHFPHHCPCAHPDLEDKVELGEGAAVCASKGGFKEGEMQRKVELARKGLL